MSERDAVLVPQIVAVQYLIPHFFDHQFGRVNFPALQQAAVALIEGVIPCAVLCLHGEVIVIFQIPRPLLLLRQRLRFHDGMTARHALCKFADVLHRGTDLHVIVIEIFDLLRTLVPIRVGYLHNAAVRYTEQLVVHRVDKPHIILRQGTWSQIPAPANPGAKLLQGCNGDVLNPSHRLVLTLCQIVRTGGLDAPLGVTQSFPWNLPFLHRKRAVFVKDLVPDTLEIFPQMQIRLLVEEVDRLVVLYYGVILHQ